MRARGALTAAIAVLLVVAMPYRASAATFKFDTIYQLSGNFHFGLFGELTLDEQSYLYYDSAEQRFVVNAVAEGNRYTSASFEINMLLGAATPQHTSIVDSAVVLDRDHEKVAFQYLPLSARKHGKTQIGSLGIDGSGHRDGEYMLFSSMMPYIREYKNSLYLFSWISAWGNGWDVHADPKFRLTEMQTPTEEPPGNEIPEPLSLLLLSSGLGAAALKRRANTPQT